MQRHAAILDGGGSILQETRHWHEDTGITTSGREKSDAEDYRYFPEPDLVPVAPSPRVGRGAARHAAREPDRDVAPGCRPSGASPTSRCATPSAPARSAWSRRPSRPAPRPQAARKWWLGELARRANEAGVEHRRRSASRPADVARVQALVDDGHDQRQAGPPGLRRAARRRGHARRDRRGPRPGDRLRRRRPRRRRRQRDRRQPRRRRQDPRRQGRRRRRADRRGDEGDARPGRRRPGARADPGEADLTPTLVGTCTPRRGLDNLLGCSRVPLVTSPTNARSIGGVVGRGMRP